MMRLLTALVVKEFKRISRNKFMLRVIFALPVVQLLILPFAAEFEMKSIGVCVVDNDNSELSRELVQRLDASKYFEVKAVVANFKKGLDGIMKDDFDLILEIPNRFEKTADIAAAENASYDNALSATFNAVNGVKSGLAASYLNSVVSDFAMSQMANEKSYSPRIISETQFRYNEGLSYKPFIVPAIIVLILSIVGGLLAALNVVDEKERGTVEQMRVAPISNWIFLTAKTIPIWIIGMLILTIGMVLAYVIYAIYPKGSYITVCLFGALYLAAFTSFGLIISALSQTTRQAILTFMFFMIIFLLMGGVFTPISSMPEWAQKITLLNPVRYFAEVMRAIFLKGLGLIDLWKHFAIIAAFALTFNFVGIFSNRKE